MKRTRSFGILLKRVDGAGKSMNGKNGYYLGTGLEKESGLDRYSTMKQNKGWYRVNTLLTYMMYGRVFLSQNKERGRLYGKYQRK